MNFIYEEPLLRHMRQKGKTDIIVEVVSSDSSDFEVTELHVYLASRKQAEHFQTKKHFRAVQTEAGSVLLPPYKLEYDDTITFGLKQLLFIKYVSYQGIRL